MLYHVNGSLVPSDEAQINVEDRGFLYGDAAFETLRAYNGTVFEWEAHAARLRETCHGLRLHHELTSGEIRERIDTTLEANHLQEAYIRVSITRGIQPGKLTPTRETNPSVVIILKELPRSGTTGKRPWSAPAHTKITHTRKIPNDAIPAHLKTHNYLNGILARLELRDTPAEESILLTHDGTVAEGATSNVFFVENGTLCTPGESNTILPGITRKVVLKLARTAGIPVNTDEFRPRTLKNADECFLTNTTWEIRPVASIDETTFETGPVTKQLIQEFNSYVDRHHYTKD